VKCVWMRRARGGGVECPEYYPNAEILFMNLANIHSIRLIERSHECLSLTLEWNGIFYFLRITIAPYGTASAVTSAINVCIGAHCAPHYFQCMVVEPVCRIRIRFWIRRIHTFWFCRIWICYYFYVSGSYFLLLWH
jgi:hypothetical protein